MLNLLRADLMRLRREKSFFVGVLAIFVVGLFAVLTTFHDNLVTTGFKTESPDELFFSESMLIGITSALFIAFFIGTEYSDGTMRNKLISGHTRASVYFSELITCAVGALIQHVIYLVTVTLSGSLLLGGMKTPPARLVLITLMSFLAVFALASIFVMLALLIPGKAAIAIILIAALILLIVPLSAMNKLSEPEFVDIWSISDESGNQSNEQMPNPLYPRGVWRQIYGFMKNFFPNGQMFQAANLLGGTDDGTVSILPMMSVFMGYSLLIALISTGAGIIVFKRKDLK